MIYECKKNKICNMHTKYIAIYLSCIFTCPDILVVGSCTCSRASMEWLLSKEGTGNALVLVVGGATEALNAWPGSFNLQLKNRKGFVRLALKHG